MSLDQHHKAMLRLGCLSVLFDSGTVREIIHFISSAIGKDCKLRKERLPELGAPWPKKLVDSNVSIHFLIISYCELFDQYYTFMFLHFVILS